MQSIAPVRQMLRVSPRRRRFRLRVVTMPKTFKQAILRGWKIVSEKTNLEADKRHRWGSVVLALAGRPNRLSFDYTASVALGYDFGKPQLL